jgi:hypothetical protein
MREGTNESGVSLCADLRTVGVPIVTQLVTHPCPIALLLGLVIIPTNEIPVYPMCQHAQAR